MNETNKFTRREFMKRTAVAGAAIAISTKLGVQSAYAVAANSDNLRKWIQPLRGLGGDGIPVAQGVPDPNPAFPNTMFYEITAGEFEDQLHPDLPNKTKLWGYWDTNNPIKRHLGGLIIARRGTATRIRFTNALPDKHIIPVDPTVMTMQGVFTENRIAVHLHGGFIPWICDGGPFDWWDPAGAFGGSFQNGQKSLFDTDQSMSPTQADYFYPNDQSARLMWYHDHAYGITRINAYAGLATGYLVLDAVNDDYVKRGKIPGLGSTIPLVFQDKVFVGATTLLTYPSWATVARPDVQVAGSLFYEHVYDPKQFKLLKGAAYTPPPNPSCIPEFYGDTMLTNGTVYPLLTVEAKRYRFLMLNACNARVLNLNLFKANPKNVDGIDLDPKTLFPLNPPGPNMIQIGNEAGFLLKEKTFVSPVPTNPVTFSGNLLMAPADRADVIIDFTGLAGQEFIIYNDAPAPFPVGAPTNDYFLGNPNNPIQPVTIRNKATGQKWSTGPDTRQILRIKVTPLAGASDSQPAGSILEPALIDPAPLVDYPSFVAPLAPLLLKAGVNVARTRNLTLNEDFDANGRLRQRLGTDVPNGVGGFGLDLLQPPTEDPKAGDVEIWNIYNTTGDTHPIHFHLVNVNVIQRQPFKLSQGAFLPAGPARGPELNEVGWKETVQMHPGEMTTVVMKFDLPATPFEVPASQRLNGLGYTEPKEYVWHCHILEHEEHDMMRPLVVTGSPLVATSLQEISLQEIGENETATATFFVTGATSDLKVTPDSGAPPVQEINSNYFTVAVGKTVAVGSYLYAVQAGDSTVQAELRVY